MATRTLETRFRPWAARLALGVLVAGTVAVPERAAHAAEQDDLERARSLFREGLSLEAAGNWAKALAKFQEVGRVKLTPQVRYHIARCQENLGRLNEALGEYRLAEYEASQQELAELSSISEARGKLEARIPKVVIKRGEGAEQSHVALDGVELGEPQLGAPLSVDPGPHQVRAMLPDGSSFIESFSVAEGEAAEVVLVAPAATAAPDVSVAGTAAPPGGPADTGDGSGPGALPWIVGGAGVASLGASGVFFLLKNGAESDLSDTCRGSVCPESVHGTQNAGETYALLAPIFLGVGIAGIGTAAVLFLVSGSDDAKADAWLPVTVDAFATGREGGVTVSGRF